MMMSEPFTFPPPNPRCRPLRLTDVYSHSAPINCVSLGRKSAAVMATGGDDCLVNCWKVGRPSPLLSLSGHTTEVDSVAFDSREDLLCGGSRGGSLKLWDCASEKLIRSLTGHRAAVLAIDFHPFGDFFASAAADCNVKVWDIKKKGCMQTYKGHDTAITQVTHSPDGRWIVSGDTAGVVKVWDLTAGRLVTELRTRGREAVASLAFHPAEFLLAVAGQHSVGVWDMETFELVVATPREAGGIRQVTFDREGTALLSAQADSLRVWAWEPAQCWDSVEVAWGGLGDLSISPNRELIGAGKVKGQVHVHLLDLPLLAPYHHAADQENLPLRPGEREVWEGHGQGRPPPFHPFLTPSHSAGQGQGQHPHLTQTPPSSAPTPPPRPSPSLHPLPLPPIHPPCLHRPPLPGRCSSRPCPLLCSPSPPAPPTCLAHPPPLPRPSRPASSPATVSPSTTLIPAAPAHPLNLSLSLLPPPSSPHPHPLSLPRRRRPPPAAASSLSTPS